MRSPSADFSQQDGIPFGAGLNDGDVRKFADKLGIETVSVWELPLPAAKQMKMYDEEETNATTGEAQNKLEADPAHPPCRSRR